MDNTQYIMLSKQTGLFRQVGVIANNVANTNTTGFQSDDMIYQNFPVMLNSMDHKPRSVDYANDIGTVTNTNPGPIDETGNELDFAIHGPGFFIVQSPLGSRYTRAGDFHLDGGGQLVNAQGYPVLGQDFQPIVFQPGDKDITVFSDGSLTARQDGQTTANTRGQIGVAVFPDSTGLQQLPNSLFSSTQTGQAPTDGTFQVAQGVLEKSNVNSVTEITKLIEVNRNSGYISKAISDIHTLELKALDTINKQ